MRIWLTGQCGEIIEPRTENKEGVPLLLMRDGSGARWYNVGGGENHHFHLTHPGDDAFRKYSDSLYLEEKEEEHILKGYNELSGVYFILEAPDPEAHPFIHPIKRRIKAASDRWPRVLVRVKPNDKYMESLEPEKEITIGDKTQIYMSGLYFVFHTQ